MEMISIILYFKILSIKIILLHENKKRKRIPIIKKKP